jgi:hypothetical protein
MAGLGAWLGLALKSWPRYQRKYRHAMDLIHQIGGGGQTCFVFMRSLLHDLASSPSKNAYINDQCATD